MTLGANPTAATIVSIPIAIAGVYLVQPEATVRVFGWTCTLVGVVGTVFNAIRWRERRQWPARARTPPR